ncbi:hypothetical protein TgHK011_001415 [Trichoderma gracile]|nr:hypothetical protein TgHK011_001415 [Trichoderma gracile]
MDKGHEQRKYTQEATHSSGKRNDTKRNISPRAPSQTAYGVRTPMLAVSFARTRVRLAIWGVEPVLWPRRKEERRRRTGRLC